MQRRETMIWAFYDFASTPVAFAVNSLYLPLMIIDAGGTNTLVGILPLLTGAIAVFWTPMVGLVIDQSSSDSITRRILIFFSALVGSISIIVMAHLEFSLMGLVLSFTIMSIAIQTGWTAINSFLAAEGDIKSMGTLSGIGITFGYLGGAIGAGGAVLIETLTSRNFALIFVGLFLILFSLIPSLFLKDTKNTQSIEERMKLRDTITEISQNRSLRMYLLGSILWGDAIATIMTFAAIISNEVLLIPVENVTLVVGSALPFAIIGGYIQGRLGDHYGIVKIQGMNLAIWAIGFSIIILLGSSLPIILITSVAGFALGGNVTLTRGLYAKIIPKGMEGRLFGISAIFAFFGGAIGPLVTGFVADIPGWTLQTALIVPLVFIILSMPTLWFISEEKSSSAPFQGMS
ncbi:MAG: membrane protein of unknown function [Candidatus Thorarchaeota archaeon]|nr:MAG: membrane protein of unknown function [Candidatus Thorarchaeota archaeon]